MRVSFLPGIGFRNIRGQVLGKEELLVFLGVHFRIVNLSAGIEGGLVDGQLRFIFYSIGIRARMLCVLSRSRVDPVSWPPSESFSLKEGDISTGKFKKAILL